MMREGISFPKIQLTIKKKVQYDVDVDSDTFFEEHDAIRKDPGKLHVYEIPTNFYSTLVVGPSRQHGTLQNFFEICLSLEKYPDALIEIENLLHRSAKGRKDFVVNSLHKRKTGKEMHMSIHIGNYEVDSVILDLGLDINILRKQTWENMGKPQLVWSPVQL